jgi:hypothetical protein
MLLLLKFTAEVMQQLDLRQLRWGPILHSPPRLQLGLHLAHLTLLRQLNLTMPENCRILLLLIQVRVSIQGIHSAFRLKHANIAIAE